jgi:hypothetical protein
MSVRTPARSAVGSSAGASKPASRQQMWLLAGLVAVLGALVIFVVLPAVSGGSGSPASVPGPAGAQPATPAAAKPTTPRRDVVDVHLDRLGVSIAEPTEGGRNPFRMGAAPPTPGQAAAAARPTGPPVPAGPPVPVGPPPPPPVPPIALKFIGIVTASGQAGKIAVLTDGKNVFSGKEQEVVDGRYRIVRIGEESIQVEHADGRGRQTIRLASQ